MKQISYAIEAPVIMCARNVCSLNLWIFRILHQYLLCQHLRNHHIKVLAENSFFTSRSDAYSTGSQEVADSMLRSGIFFVKIDHENLFHLYKKGGY